MTTRTPLPHRRPCATEVFDWRGKDWHLTVGFDEAGKVREFFLDGPKVGSEMEATLTDACVSLSVMVQSGFDISAIDGHLGREGVEYGAPAASPLGMIASLALDMEKRHGADAVMQYKMRGNV